MKLGVSLYIPLENNTNLVKFLFADYKIDICAKITIFKDIITTSVR